jgi:hypothetical protein
LNLAVDRQIQQVIKKMGIVTFKRRIFLHD